MSMSLVQNANVPQPPVNYPQRRIYIHKSTKNKSFLDMHYYLKSIGIKNNDFMLALLDPDLAGVNPYDPSLSVYYKQKILREVMSNYWYYLREVIRVPSPGGAPTHYQLNRANLALNFLTTLSINTYLEVARQLGKTTSVIIRYLYIYNFATTNTKIAFLHKGLSGSRDNLQDLKNIRDLLPDYLQLKERPMGNGKVERGKDNTMQMINPFNGNNIMTFAGATTQARAASILRGKSLSMLWIDEVGFLQYNDIIYLNGAPALNTAMKNSAKNGAPHGIIFTSTPGFLSTPEGQFAYSIKEEATPFSETWYDLTYPQLRQILDANTKSDFVYVKFSYQELGMPESWYTDVCKLLKNSWPDIRREILLEWSNSVGNSPFNPDNLEMMRSYIKNPISVVYLLGKYRFETYLRADTRTYPAIIGVDVSSGYKQDSSTITVIDSQTTKVLGCMNCNFISPTDLARCIEFIVKNWMPNSIVCVERNVRGICIYVY